MLKKQKIFFFLMVGLVSAGFLLGEGKEAKGAWIESYTCSYSQSSCCNYVACFSWSDGTNFGGARYDTTCGTDCDSGWYLYPYIGTKCFNECGDQIYCTNGQTFYPVSTITRCHYISSWYCSGSTPISVEATVNGASCSDAGIISCVVNGVCGAANGGTFATSPTVGLCSTGTVSTVNNNPTTWNWTCAGSSGGTTASCSANKSNFTLTATKAGTGAGTISSNPAGINNCSGTCAYAYAPGTSVVLTATPTAGSSFASWSGGGCSGTGTCTVVMDAAKTTTATFIPAPVPGLANPTYDNASVPSSWDLNTKIDLCIKPAASNSDTNLVPNGNDWTWICPGSGGAADDQGIAHKCVRTTTVWSLCSALCGGGVSIGTYMDTECQNQTEGTQSCNSQPCLNEGYKEVAPW